MRNLSLTLALAAALTAHAQTHVWRFSFDGKPTPGDTPVTAEQTYSRESGHGFEPGSLPNAAGQPSFFSVDLPEGNYRVTASLGGA